jgi:sialate O-acetylesterase
MFLMLVAATACCTHARADVRLPAILGDHMVLQQGPGRPVWGWADPGEQVVVSIAGQKQAVVADQQGNWKTTVELLQPGGPVEMTVRGKNTLTIKDILIGEVWFCSGQSNMELGVAQAADAEKEIAQADYPQIRLFDEINDAHGEKKDPLVIFSQPQKDLAAAWQACTPASVGRFSAAAYYFGRELHQARRVPVGLIHASLGGSQVEAWTPLDILRATAEAQPILQRWEPIAADFQKKWPAYEKALEKWAQQTESARATQKPLPKEPRRPFGPGHRYEPAGAFNGMVAPVIPFAIRGVIWYQGESNRDRAWQYRALLPAMIKSWRQQWGQGDFPFLIVQIPGYAPPPKPPATPAPQDSTAENEWAELRDAQAFTARTVANTALVVAIDIGECRNIHPKNKQEVGRRLALAAQALAYGQDVAYCGPLYRDCQPEPGKIRLNFTHAAGGLTALEVPEGTMHPATCPAADAVVGFAVAGADRQFHRAEAHIDGQSVVVGSPDVSQPIAVRYGWAGCPRCNLYNKAGLPASPFRTDDWPLSTQGKE